MQVVTQALTRRLEAAETACWWAAFSALGRWPGNPYGFELRAFGNARALLCRALPQSGSFNKVLCAGAADMAALDEALAYAAEAGVLIGARLADADAAGCDLVCSQTDPVTVSQHNMERAGLRMAYTKVEFHPIA